MASLSSWAHMVTHTHSTGGAPHLPSTETLLIGTPGRRRSHMFTRQSRELLTSVCSLTSARPETAFECCHTRLGAVGLPFMFHLQRTTLQILPASPGICLVVMEMSSEDTLRRLDW